jgi:hypothetical protein
VGSLKFVVFFFFFFFFFGANCTFSPLTIESSQFSLLSIKSSDVPFYVLKICKSLLPFNFMLNPSQNNGIFLKHINI